MPYQAERLKGSAGEARRPGPGAARAGTAKLAGAGAAALWLTLTPAPADAQIQAPQPSTPEPAPGARAEAPGPEASIKAAYLYEFATFVTWPAKAFPSPSSPFYLCVLGEAPFGAALDQAVSGRRVGAHPTAVRRLDRVDAASGCHILFLGDSKSQSAADAVRDLRGEPVLTVSDQSSPSSGAIIQFVAKDNRVRFDIDASVAAANHITISSKLLSLAISNRAGA